MTLNYIKDIIKLYLSDCSSIIFDLTNNNTLWITFLQKNNYTKEIYLGTWNYDSYKNITTDLTKWINETYEEMSVIVKC